MYGIVGVLIFLPFYVLVIKVIVSFVRLAKHYYRFFLQRQDAFLLMLIGIASSSEFIKNFIEYPNWFYPIGTVPDRAKFFIYFGLLLGSYYGLVKIVNVSEKKFHEE